MSTRVYKICQADEWTLAVACSRYTGSPDDQRDGFIHLSTASQLAGTLARHFAGERNLVLVAFEAGDLGASLRFEPSRRGELFPHVYGSLDPAVAGFVRPLPLAPDGQFVLPQDLS